MTSTGMQHEQAREALASLALDTLDVSERSSVLAHLARCADCRDELASLSVSAAELSYVVKPVPMPQAQGDRVRARLLARAAADRAQVPDNHVTQAFHLLVPHNSPTEVAGQHRRAMAVRTSWGVIAAGIVAIASAGTAWQVMHQRDTLSDSYALAAAERALAVATADSLRTLVEDRERLIRNLTGPQVAVVTLTSAGVRAPSARMFWDQSVNQWTFVAHNLPMPRSGRAYQLWLVSGNQKISAGTFMPTTNGDAVVRANHPMAKDALSAVAVTDEPSNGSAQPTTIPIIAGTNSGR